MNEERLQESRARFEERLDELRSAVDRGCRWRGNAQLPVFTARTLDATGALRRLR